MMQDQELKAKWLKALRSGDYKQGQGTFENEGEYCCLGVLCAVAGVPLRHDNGSDNYSFVDACVGGKSIVHCLYDMNDAQGRDFSEIAIYIERNL